MEVEVPDPFWLDNPSVLVSVNDESRLKEIWPSPDMTKNEKLNAIARLILFATLGIFLYTRTLVWLAIGLILVFATVLFKEKPKKNRRRKNKKGLSNYHSSKECSPPTVGNPLQNVLPTEFTGFNRAPACPADQVAGEIKENLNDKMYRDLHDPYQTSNHDYQWASMPSTQNPNDREAFTQWCYGQDKVCKDGDFEVCTGYENAGGKP